jgi:hypothetical protein
MIVSSLGFPGEGMSFPRVEAKQAAVLFARKRSIYKKIAALDVYDIERDARTYAGNLPVISHPPCRGWGRLRHLANCRPGEIELAIFAVDQVRRCGGVLEHPAGSRLWKVAGLPSPGEFDEFGGFTVSLYQGAFGHRAPKHTWLYVCGVRPGDLPVIPDMPFMPEGRVQNMSAAERERTPLQFALWLFDLAIRCAPADAAPRQLGLGLSQ